MSEKIIVQKEEVVAEKTLRFTVDSALLAELGERLIGKPFIALAELVKNSYDADATWVRINLDLSNDRIVIGDNGHGMSFNEFKDFWMRIGSTHKKGRFSRNLRRLMTGSKGVGRLAVQFLSQDFRLDTTSDEEPKRKLAAEIKWNEAVKAGELTEARVKYRITASNTDFPHGTTIILSRLKQDWKRKEIEDLAGEIWQLRPPSFGVTSDVRTTPASTFDIELSSQEKKIATAFRERLTAIEDVWHARIVGQNDNGTVKSSLQFSGEDPTPLVYKVPASALEDGIFDIRVYKLTGKKPRGIRVGEARDYLRNFGGVRVYDAGFQLPYYGKIENDWLGVEVEHSHRLEASQLLPKELQVQGGLSFLPTMTRMLGIVRVDTSKEDYLHITITRDRLQENKAYDDLRLTIRYALHYYAMEEARREFANQERSVGVQRPRIASVAEVLDEYRDRLPKNDYVQLRKDVIEATEQTETEAERASQRVGLLGPLATAGISMLALQHQLRQQFATVDGIILGLSKIKVTTSSIQAKIDELRASLSEWLVRARATNDLFSFLADSRNIQDRKRYRARVVIDDCARQLGALSRGIPIVSTRMDRNMLLPPGSIAEWSAIFQNVFTNAFNALVDAENKMIDVSTRTRQSGREILIQNTGVPINLDKAERFFEPFVREINISTPRQRLGYGGTGLGLTIVRMIASSLGCTVEFVIPEKRFNTAVALKWRESE